MEMLISFSSRTLAPIHTAKTTSKWFADNDITVLDWPANMPDLNPSIECINEHTLKNLNFSVLQIFFLTDLRKYSNILRYWIFDFHEL